MRITDVCGSWLFTDDEIRGDGEDYARGGAYARRLAEECRQEELVSMHALLEQVAASPNLILAWDTVKGRLQNQTCQSFAWRLEDHLLDLSDALLASTDLCALGSTYRLS